MFVTAGQQSEDMLVSKGTGPGCAQRMTRKQVLTNRQNLLADQDTEQTDERNDRWRRRTNAQATVEETNGYSCGQSNDINSHCDFLAGSGRCGFARVTSKHGVCVNQAKAVGATICTRESGSRGVSLAPRPIPLEL